MKVYVPRRQAAICCCVLLVWLLAFAPVCSAYSVLTHEEIIDLLWDQQIKPLLLARFPNATPEDLKTAHAYAYGGSDDGIGYLRRVAIPTSFPNNAVRCSTFRVTMLQFVRDYGGNVKQAAEVWINGMAAENVGTKAAPREVTIDPA